MTFDEVVRRILLGHWALLLVAVLVPIVATTVWYSQQSPSWSASVRMETISPGTASSTQSAALSARILALATTPSLVKSAMTDAGVPGDPETVAAHQISAERLGDSPVVVLTVTAPARNAAESLVTQLARRVSDFVNDSDSSSYGKVLSQAESSLAAARQKEARLASALSNARSVPRQASLTAQLQGVQGEIQRLHQLKDSLTLQRLGGDRIVTVDLDTPDVQQASAGLVPRLALAMILGTLIGLFGAVLLETLRPRLPGVRFLARSLEAPVLGETGQGTVALTNAMTRAARRAGVDTLVLMGVGERDDNEARRLLAECAGQWQPKGDPLILERLEVPMSGRAERSNGGVGGRGVLPSFPAFARLTSLAGVTHDEERSAGVVVVSSGRNREKDVAALRDVLDAMRWSVVGVIHAPRSRFRLPRVSWLARLPRTGVGETAEG